MALTGTRVDTWLTHVQLGPRFLGTWDQFSGGEVDSEETKYKPGGVDYEITAGGRRTFGNVTIARYWDDWVNAQYAWLQKQCGKTFCWIARYPLTSEFVILGAPQWYSGTWKRVSPPDYDSMGNDVALIEAEITVDRVW